MSRRILISGSEGKVAKEVIKLFPKDNLLLVDKRGGESMQCNLAFDNLKFISDFRPEIVIHLAASFERTDETPMFHQLNYEDNLMASYRLNKVIAELDYCPSHYIFASSYLVYDPMLYLSEVPLKNPVELSEVHEIAPRNLCGSSKLYTEGEINFLQRNVHQKMKVCHARIFRVFGEGGQEFISRLIEWKKLGMTVDIWKPENKFDYIHTSDCASAIKAMIDSNLNGIYNVGTGASTSIGEILDAINPKVRRIKQGDLYEWSCAMTSKLEEESGWTWKPKVEVIEWIKERVK